MTDRPTFWYLDHRNSWRSDANSENDWRHDQVSVGKVIRLTADPDGPLALNGGSGTLGGLTLPRRMALDDSNLLYLAGNSKKGPWIKRFNPDEKNFALLPTAGGKTSDVWPFSRINNIAATRRNLYVVSQPANSSQNDGQKRPKAKRWVHVFDSKYLVLRHRWRRRKWRPVDVVARDGVAYILDGRLGRIYRHLAGKDNLETLVKHPQTDGRYSRLALDRQGNIYVLVENDVPHLAIYDTAGNFITQVDDAGTVREAFDPPPIQQDHKNRFCLPDALSHDCNRRLEQLALSPSNPIAACLPWSAERLIFWRDGRRVKNLDPADLIGPKPYVQKGVWISGGLDSDIYQCQWHRIELQLSALPVGTQIIISTYSSEAWRKPEEIEDLLPHLWQISYVVTGQMQPEGENNRSSQHEFLVQSREGQHLWVRLELRGNGFDSPAVRSLRVHYPRNSYLEFVPGVYQADDESRWFLERFLSIMQTVWDGLEVQIETIYRYFDPSAVPDNYLPYLAAWLALPTEGTWDAKKQRNLLKAASQIYKRRGTAHSLRHYVQVYLQNITGIPIQEQQAFPHIVEGFRERQHMLLGTNIWTELGRSGPLWGPSSVGRLQLDIFSREGEIRLISTGDPDRDVFFEYAHRFRVFVPSVWIGNKAEEAMLRRALDAEKPAHTQYDLCLVESHFRIGRQSTIGIDTIIGAYPQARLASREKDDLPPSRPPLQRLGYDTVLAKGKSENGIYFQPGTRLGQMAIL